MDRSNQPEVNVRIVTNESLEAVDALEMSARLLAEAAHDSTKWKWAMLALHSAIQGFMVLALRGTWAVGTLHRDDRDRKIVAHHRQMEALARGDLAEAAVHERVVFGEERLARFDHLYARIKDPEQWAMQHLGNERVFEPGPGCDDSMEWLNNFRHDSLHFRVGTRSRLLSRLPTIVLDGLSVVAFLKNETRLIMWMPWENLEHRADVALTQAIAAAEHLKSSYEALMAHESESQ